MTRFVTTSQVLQAASDRLAQAGVENPRLDAELLAMHATELNRAGLLMATEFPPTALGAYWDLIERRSQRIPLQHLTGETGFRFLTIGVEPGVFIPRPETEMVAEAAIRWVAHHPGPLTVVDLCTGAGGIALACAQEIPRAHVWAVDANPQAVELTHKNAQRNQVHVTALCGVVEDESLLQELNGAVDILISNPPYIPFESEPIDIEVREHDPPQALYGGGQDGLDVPRAVIQAAHRLLRTGGLLVIEHGDEQGPAMRQEVINDGGFTNVRTQQDLTDRDRMVIAIRAKVAD